MSGPFGGVSSRNFGWGKGLGYAGGRALCSSYGGGHFATVATHRSRWQGAVDFFHANAITDAKKISQHDLEEYAKHVVELVEDGIHGLSYGVNLISSANVTIESIRGDSRICVKPTDYLHARQRIRLDPPSAMDRALVLQCAEDLRANGLLRAAAVLELGRFVGTRLREAALADLTRWHRELQQFDRVNVQDGTKGGRNAPRWVPVDDYARAAIRRALEARPSGSRNLLAMDEALIEGYRGEFAQARAIMKAYGIERYHDARAAYACDVYQQITGLPAPVFGQKILDRKLDRKARQRIAYLLGHGRIDVVGSYCGGRR